MLNGARAIHFVENVLRCCFYCHQISQNDKGWVREEEGDEARARICFFLLCGYFPPN